MLQTERPEEISGAGRRQKVMYLTSYEVTLYAPDLSLPFYQFHTLFTHSSHISSSIISLRTIASLLKLIH